MIHWMQPDFPGHEVNLVFARGVRLEALAQGLGDRGRAPLAQGEGGGWVWAVHDMLDAESGDYEPLHYGLLRPDATEIVVFVTEPCSAKAHGSQFEYYRDGRLTLLFSFEDWRQQRVGDNPDYLSAELLAAGLIGPDAYCDLEESDEEHDCFDHTDEEDERLMRLLIDFYRLPSPPIAVPPPQEVTAR